MPVPLLRKVILPVIFISPGLLRIRMCLELTGNDMKRVEIARAEIHLDKPLHMGHTARCDFTHIN